MISTENKDETTPAPRVPLKMGVDFRRSYGRSSEAGELKNISLTGAFLEHQNTAIDLNEKIVLTFLVGGRSRKISAEIIWSSPSGSGIRFLPHNNRDIQIIDDLIYFVESRRETRRSLIDEIFKRAG